MPLSDSSGTCMRAVWPEPSPAVLLPSLADRYRRDDSWRSARADESERGQSQKVDQLPCLVRSLAEVRPLSLTRCSRLRLIPQRLFATAQQKQLDRGRTTLNADQRIKGISTLKVVAVDRKHDIEPSFKSDSSQTVELDLKIEPSALVG